MVERASDGNAAYIRLDVKRRHALTAHVGSPLLRLVDPETPATERTTATVPTALDLPDVAEPATTAANYRRVERHSASRPDPSAATPVPPAVAGAGGEDLTDWV